MTQLIARKLLRLGSLVAIGSFCFFSLHHAAAASQNGIYKNADGPAVYQDDYLTGLDFPIGAVGGSLIRMNGKAELAWWQIFNNFAERKGSDMVPMANHCHSSPTSKSALAWRLG